MSDLDLSEWFTTEEVLLETNRLRRRHYRRMVGTTLFFGGGALLAISTFLMLVGTRAEIWPTWVRASSSLPGSPVLHYRFILIEEVAVSLYSVWRARKAWIHRVPEEGEYVETAVVKLTERGGL